MKSSSSRLREVSDAEKRARCDESEYGLIDNLDGAHPNRMSDKLRCRIHPFDGKISRFDRHASIILF